MVHPESASLGGPGGEYRWNEWDLRREALQLAKMTTKADLASQTIWSEAHREAGVQV